MLDCRQLVDTDSFSGEKLWLHELSFPHRRKLPWTANWAYIFPHSVTTRKGVESTPTTYRISMVSFTPTVLPCSKRPATIRALGRCSRTPRPVPTNPSPSHPSLTEMLYMLHKMIDMTRVCCDREHRRNARPPAPPLPPLPYYSLPYAHIA